MTKVAVCVDGTTCSNTALVQDSDCRLECRLCGGAIRETSDRLGSSSASRARDLAAGQVTSKLAGPIPAFHGLSAVGHVQSLAKGRCAVAGVPCDITSENNAWAPLNALRLSW